MIPRNASCDGADRRCVPGEVRLLPFPGGNLILCRACHRNEIDWRRERNESLAHDCRFDLPDWESLEVYSEG